MRCCQGTTCGTGRFFSRFAARYRRRYQKQGFERSQEQLVAGLCQTGLQGRSLLEIGCGVGYLHQRLLLLGARDAVGVDLAPLMLDEARVLAAESGLSARVQYHAGDFIELAPVLAPADITLLDKVVCCYPDAYTLLQATLDKTAQTCALIYPRDRFWVRWGIALIALVLRLVGDQYRPYFYDPEHVGLWIRERGFERVFSSHTPLWLTEIYQRRSGGVPHDAAAGS